MLDDLKNVLQGVLISLKLFRHVRTSGTPVWGGEEATELSRFLGQPCGRKLWVILHQFYERKAVSACSSGGGAFASGRVAGFRDAIAMIELMSKTIREDEISLDDGDSASSSLHERYRP